MSSDTHIRARQRLQPLYWAAFSQGLVFWYTVDKLLATRVGITTAQVGFILATMSIVTVIAEIPSGILADRWSRKGVLLVSLVALSGSTFFGLIATAPWHYWALSVCWGVYYAMYTGTYEAIVYDVLTEEEGHGRRFERLYGLVGRYESIGLVVASVLGGISAGVFDIKVPFAISLVSALAAVGFVLSFREPRIHKTHEVVSFTSHIGDTFRTVVSSRQLISYFCVSLLLGGVLRVFWEYLQYWYIQLSLPTALFGFANAGVLLMLWARSWAADRIVMERNALLLRCLGFGILSAVLLTIRNPYVALVAAVMTMFWLLLAELVLSGLRQALLPSRLRAGAASVFSTVGHLAFVPLGIGFGFLAQDGAVTRAVWLPLAVLAAAASIVFGTRRLHLGDVK